MFSTLTTSRNQGRVIELYRFIYGDRDIDIYRYTDAEFPITHDGEVYIPAPIERDIANNTGSMDRSSMNIQVNGRASVAQLFRIYPPAKTVLVEILQGEGDDPDGEFTPLWSGRVLSVAWETPTATLTCEPMTVSLGRTGLRRHYQYMCPHLLYGDRCKANKAAATVTATAGATTGRSVTLTTLLASAEKYAGGMIEWTTSSGLPQSMLIVGTSTFGGYTQLLLGGIPVDITLGTPLSVVKGCIHTIQACKDDHNNVPNFGGMPWIPTKNMVGGASPFV